MNRTVLNTLIGILSQSSSNLPAGAIELEYIEGTGTQWIDTLITPTNYTGAKVIGNYTTFDNVDKQICGVNDGGNYRFYVPYMYLDTQYYYGYGSYLKTTGITATLDKSIFEINFKNNRKTGVNGQLVDIATTRPTGSMHLKLFTMNVDFPISKFRMYSFQATENTELTHDFIPVKLSTGEIGMWCTVTKQFYGNSGTGTFIGGPAINKTGVYLQGTLNNENVTKYFLTANDMKTFIQANKTGFTNNLNLVSDDETFTDASYMCYGLNNITQIDASEMFMDNVTTIIGFFGRINSLRIAKFHTWKINRELSFNAFFNQTDLIEIVMPETICNNLAYFAHLNYNLKLIDFSNVILTDDCYVDNAFIGCTAVTEAYAKTQADCDLLNASSGKPANINFVVKPANQTILKVLIPEDGFEFDIYYIQGNYGVDWGDGVANNKTNKHIYETAGEYTIKIAGATIFRFTTSSLAETPTCGTIIECVQTDINMTSHNRLFMKCNNMVNANIMCNDLVTSISEVVSSCEKLKTLNFVGKYTNDLQTGNVCGYCSELENVNFEIFDIGFLSAFSMGNCHKLKKIDFSNVKFVQKPNYYDFDNCDSVTEAYGRTQEICDLLNTSGTKPTTWQFVVKGA